MFVRLSVTYIDLIILVKKIYLFKWLTKQVRLSVLWKRSFKLLYKSKKSNRNTLFLLKIFHCHQYLVHGSERDGTY